MFSVEDLTGTEGKVVLQSARSRVEILPLSGAILNAWFTDTAAGDRLNLIKGYDGPADFSEQVTDKGFRSCKMNPFVGRLSDTGYTLGETTYLPRKFALKGLPIHGLIYDAAYEVVHTQADEQGSTVQLECHYPGTDPGFPFRYRVKVTYLLSADRTLTIRTEVWNQHDEAIPMCDGWHPYFNLGSTINDCTLELATSQLVVFNEQLVPTGDMQAYDRFRAPATIGDTELDNSFWLQQPLAGPACSFTNPANGLQLQSWPDPSYPVIHFYTPADRQSLAIENTSAVPDAFNNRIGLVQLQPGESHTFSTTYKIIAE